MDEFDIQGWMDKTITALLFSVRAMLLLAGQN
jgi:hypothetical protein